MQSFVQFLLQWPQVLYWQKKDQWNVHKSEKQIWNVWTEELCFDVLVGVLVIVPHLSESISFIFLCLASDICTHSVV